jgi:ribonuclease HIII
MPVSWSSVTCVTVAAALLACQNPRVSQKTLVVQMPRARGVELKRRLEAGAFDFRSVPHALFSVKGEGVVATFYESGKLVVQGDQPEMFVEHWLGAEAAREAGGRTGAQGAVSSGAVSGSAANETVDDSEALIGSDECGKGDYFGPLVVAAVLLEPGQASKLRAAGVRDSKTLSDEQCKKLGAALRGVFPHAVVRLDPPRYNAIYVPGKLNDLLGSLHAEAIAQLARPGIRVLVDQFANAKVMQQKLGKLDLRLEQRTHAESNAAVAAASIIAREEFLTALAALSEDAAVDLHKGAGPPVDLAAERFVAIHGMDGLSKVAKLHFKNTQKIRPPR